MANPDLQGFFSPNIIYLLFINNCLFYQYTFPFKAVLVLGSLGVGGFLLFLLALLVGCFLFVLYLGFGVFLGLVSVPRGKEPTTSLPETFEAVLKIQIKYIFCMRLAVLQFNIDIPANKILIMVCF